mmetsp:Transcript_12239/g.37740  ORF Transcript_12239/g.37740 Transcript_12239/m.37740 type:complete len:121 (+) Transcript_12239:131-493(+)
MGKENLDTETIDNVMALLSAGCRRETDAALDTDAEPSLECKQEIQAALAGFSHELDPGELPKFEPEGRVVRHQQAIGYALLAVTALVVLFREYSRRRRSGSASKAKKKGGKAKGERKKDK